MNFVRRPGLWVLLLPILLLSCVDGASVTESDWTESAALALVPRIIEPVGSAAVAGTVDQIRLTARHAGTQAVLATSEQAVDPAASSWQLSFEVPVPADGGQVLVDVELISAGVVEWSGTQGPLTLTPGAPTAAQEVPVYRGPLDNLSVTGITISGAPPSLAQGATVQLSAAVQTSGAGGTSPTVFWGSTDPLVATVSGDGTVTGVAPGTASITASAGPVSDQVSFPVTTSPASIVVTPGTATSASLGEQLTFQAQVLDQAGTVMPGAQVTWSSSDPTVLQAVTGGDFLSVGNGAAQAIATSADNPSISGTSAVTVRQDITTLLVDLPVVGLTAVGETSQITATALDALGATVSDAAMVWTSSDPAVATVSATGLITAVGAGTATVSVTASEPAATDGPAGEDSPARVPTTETIAVTVTLTVPAALTLTPPSAAMTQIGGTLQLVAEFVDAAGGVSPATGLTWISTQSTVASVDSNGLVTAISNGSTIIRATGQGLTASASITVGGADLIVSAFMVTPDGGSTVNDVTMTAVMVYVDNVGSFAAPASDLALRVLDAGTTAPITPDVTVAVPALPAGGQHIVSMTLGGQSPGSLPAAVIFEAVADVGGIVAEFDESNNKATSASFPVAGGGGAPPGTTHTWTGAADSDWFNAANWSAGTVPTSSDNVWIPISAVPQPTVGSTGAVTGNLIIGPGATLTLSSQFIDVFGDLDAGTTITGTGEVRMFGTGSTVQGTMLVDLFIGAKVAANGPLSVGTLTVDGSTSELDVNGQPINVSVDFYTQLGGRLKMSGSPTAHLAIAGLAIFDGAGLPGDLTQGTITFMGDLQGGADATAFGPTVGHVSRFAGSGPQSITFASPGSGQQRFGDVDIAPGALVAFSSDAHVLNSLVIQGTVDIPSGLTVNVDGNVDVQAGGSLNVDGTLTSIGACTVTGTLTGAGTSPCAAPAFSKTWVGGAAGGATDWDNPNNWSPIGVPAISDDALVPVTGNDPITTTSVDINDLTVQAGASVTVSGPTLLRVYGDLDAGTGINGPSSVRIKGTGSLVQGILNTQLRIDAGAAATASGPLTIANSSSLVLADHFSAGGQVVSVTGAFSSFGSGLLEMTSGGVINIGGAADFDGLSTAGLLTSGQLVLNNDLSTGGATTAQFQPSGTHHTFFTGTTASQINFANPGSDYFQELTVANSGGVTLVSDADVTGDLLVTGFLVVPSGSTLSVVGAVTVGAGGSITVDGTLSTPGGCTIVAGGSVTGTGTHACSASAFSKTWVGGDPGGATDWFNTNNWSPAGIPISTDDVLIPATPNNPIAGSTTINNLQVDVAATLDLNGGTLVFNGDLEAFGPISNGVVSTNTTGGLLEGMIPDLTIDVLATRSLSGQLDVSGDALLLGQLILGAETLNVTGDFDTSGGNGRVVMQNAAGVLDVDGTITFGGTGQNGFLSNGTIYAFGDFQTSVANSATSFFANGGHLVIFDGVGPQTLTMGDPSQAFGDLENENTGSGLTLGSDVLVQGVFTNDPLGTVTGPGRTLKVAGGVDDSGAGLTVATIDVFGSPSIMPGNINGDVQIGNTVDWPNPSFIAGDLNVMGLLRLNSQVVTVGGNLTVSGASSRLQMTNSTDLMVVYGTTLFDGAGHSGYLIDGVLEVRGDLTVAATHSSQSFLASNQHEVIFNGVASQTVAVSGPAFGQNQFQNVTIRNTVPDVQMSGSDMPVQGTLDLEVGTTLAMNGNNLLLAGAFHDIGQGFSGPTIDIHGNLTSFPATVTADVTVRSGWTLNGSSTINGNLIADNATVQFDANTLTVNGNATAQGASGRFYMNNVASGLDVNGDFIVDGASTNGWLTNGTLSITGDFTQLGTHNAGSFHASSTHTTIMDGTGAQTISFASPGATGALSVFQNLVIANTTGVVTGTSPLYADGTLDVNSGATLDLSGQQLHVAGALLDPAGNLITPTIYTYGNLTSFPPTVGADVFVTAGWTLNNSSVINGTLTADNATLQFDANTLTVNGDAIAQGASGRFYMNNAGAVLDVNGHFTGDGASTNGWLIQGLLSISGDFTQGNTHTGESFHPSSTHQTVFDGTGAQSITFASPGSVGAQSLFQNVTIQNTTGVVTATSNVFADGLVDVGSGAALDLTGLQLHVAGGLQDVAGGLTVPEIYTYANLTTFPTTVNANVHVTAAWTLNNSTTINGDLTADNATLQFDANTLTVNGNATAQGASGRFYMNNAGSVLDVNGNFTGDGASTNGWMIQGILSISGDFTQGNTHSGESFHASSTHTTVFDGSGAQSITFASPGSVGGQSLFQNVTIQNTSGAVTGTTALWADGTVDIQSAAILDLSGQELRVAGALLDPSGGLTSPHVYVYGNLTAAPFSLNTHLHVVAGWTLTSNISINGALTIDNATLQLDANTVFANADVFVTGANGRFYMNNGAGIMDIAGNLSMDGASTDGWLVAGTLNIGGNFTQGSTHSASSFRSTSTHKTVFDGSGAQTFSFASPGPGGGASHFNALDILNGVSTVTGTSAVYASGTINVTLGATLDLSGQQLFVAGGLIDPAGGLIVPTVYVNGPANPFPANLNANLIVTSGWTLPNDVSVTGTTTVNNVTVQFDAHTFTSGGNFIITGANGRIYMNNALSVLDANANFSTTGTTMDGWLIDGRLEIAGNFTQGGHAASFRATGNHQTIFDGSSGQTIQFSNPGGGAGASQFRNLEITNTASSVNVTSSVYTSGTLTAIPGTTVVRPSGAHFLEVNGSLNVDGLTVDGLPIRMVLGSHLGGSTFDNVSFIGMSITDTFMYIRTPGSAVAAAGFSGLSFANTPTSGGYYVDIDSSNASILTLNMTSTAPGAPIGSNNIGTNAVLNWS